MRKIKLYAIKTYFPEKRHYLCSVIKRTKEPERVPEGKDKKIKDNKRTNHKASKGPLRRAPGKTRLELDIGTNQKANERITVMKKVTKILNKIANADPMIWGYVMLSESTHTK